MKARSCLLVLPLAAASCLATKVELDTEVYPDGSVQRRLAITSQDDGAPAEHPSLLRAGSSGYQFLRREKGVLEASGFFASGEPIAPALDFHAVGLDRSAPALASLVIQDWGLFRLFRYRERLSDVVEPDEIRLAVEEAAAVLLENADASLERLLGPHYPRTRLHLALTGELRDLGRDLAVQFWRATALEDFDEEKMVRRACAAARRAGVPLRAEDVLAAVEDGVGSDAFLAVRKAVGDWAAAQLELVEPDPTGGRVPSWPDMRSLLFDGSFALVYVDELEQRFGGEAGLDRWVDQTMTRVFGLFGANPGNIDFHLRVRLPGEPLRSTGFLTGDGAAFVSFPASEIYPGGAGLESESVLWEPALTGGLPGFRRLPGNEAAVRWTWLAGDGPASSPDPELIEVLRSCSRQRSWAPVEERLKEMPELLEAWEEALAWLRGESD